LLGRAEACDWRDSFFLCYDFDSEDGWFGVNGFDSMSGFGFNELD
jgi:hypothetical protein